MKFKWNKRLIIFLLCIFVSICGLAQNKTLDSLSIKSVMDSVFKNNPLINQLTENINGSQTKIDLAKTSYLPNIDAEAMYSRMNPNPSIFGFQLYPNNSFDAHIGVSQLIYDFGKSKTNVSLQQTGKEISEMNVVQVKQKLSIMTAVYFYSLVYLQEAEKIKIDQLNTLKKHLNYVIKKHETGSAIKYDVVSTQVKISTVENQLIEIQSNKDLQVIHLNLLMGKPSYSFTVKDGLKYNFASLPVDSLYRTAVKDRDEVIISKKKETLAQWNIDYTKAQNRPQINFIGNAGFKNGFIPDVEKVQANYFVGLGIKVPIFDANRTSTNVKLQQSNLKSNKFETENIQRTVMNEVSENYSNLLVAQKKIEQFELQLVQALELYSLAETNFKLGTVTNLDLLDAASTLAESKLQLLKTKIDQQINIIKLNASIGKRIY